MDKKGEVTQIFKCENAACSVDEFKKTHAAEVMWTTCIKCGGRCYPVD